MYSSQSIETQPVRPDIATHTARESSPSLVIRGSRGEGQSAGESEESSAREYQAPHPRVDPRILSKDGAEFAEVSAVGREADGEEKEDREFLESIPPEKRADKEYVKEHLGRYSDRRYASGSYSNDKESRFTYKGRRVNNGGYSDGKLVDIAKEQEEFGPGEPWPGTLDG